MRQTVKAQHLSNISFLLAVGHNGDAIVLSILEGNKELREDVKSMDAKTALWPTKIPQTPGIYLFRGRSTLEYFDEGQDELFKEVFHSGQCIPVLYNVDLDQFHAAAALSEGPPSHFRSILQS